MRKSNIGVPLHKRRLAVPEQPTREDIRLNWARRLKRMFGIEIEQCARCGGRLQVIASIGERELIERILAHRRERGEQATTMTSLGARARRRARCFGFMDAVEARALAVRAAGGAARDHLKTRARPAHRLKTPSQRIL